MKALTLAIVAALALGSAGTAMAEKPRKNDAKTPSSWSYEIKDGKRVPKGERRVNADGSWREEIRRGDCVTIREKTKSGEYRETREC